MRSFLLLFALVAAVLLAPAFAKAEDPVEPPAPPPPPAPAEAGDEAAEEDAEEELPPLATEEEAKEALKVFKTDYRARGYRGDETTAMREVAMRKLARTQHPLVADRLAKLTRDRNPDIRTLALMYLGYQRAIPGYAGPLVVKAMKANRNDPVFVMFAVDAIQELSLIHI